MKVEFTTDQKAIVSQAMRAGRLDREEDAVQEAMALWEARERARSVVLASIDAAETLLAAGKGRTITRPSMGKLAGEVKNRGRDALPLNRRQPARWRTTLHRKPKPGRTPSGITLQEKAVTLRVPIG